MIRTLIILGLIGVTLTGCATPSLPIHDPDAVALGCDHVAQGALRVAFGPPPPPPPPSTSTSIAGAIGGAAMLSFHAFSIALPPVGGLAALAASGGTAIGSSAIAMAGAPARPPLQEPQRTHYQTALVDCLARHGMDLPPSR